MKARYLTSAEKNAAKQAANTLYNQKMQAATTRAQYMWIAAMCNAGLSKETIMQCVEEMSNVTEKYKEYREDGVADAELMQDLNRMGFSLPPICEPSEEL